MKKKRYFDNWEVHEDFNGKMVHVGICPLINVKWKVKASSCSMKHYWSKQPICIKTGNKVHGKTCRNKGKYICKDCEGVKE